LANLIPITSFSKLANQEVSGTTTTPLVINVANIIAISTRVTPFSTTGITDVLYSLPVNNTSYQITLVCTETRAALLALANANAVAT